MNRNLLLSFLLLLLISSRGFSGIVTWENLFCKQNSTNSYSGLYSASFTTDASGKIYVLGYGEYLCGSQTCRDIIVLKYDSAGILLADTSFHIDSASYIMPLKIASSNNNTIYVLTSVIDSNGNYSSIVHAFDNELQLKWLNKFAVSGNATQTIPVDMTSDQFGNIFVTGTFLKPSQGKNIFIYRIKPTQVRNSITYSNTNNLASDDVVARIKTDAKGNIYFCGYQTSATLAREMLLGKISKQFALSWVRSYNYNSNATDDFATDLAVDNFNAFVTGQCRKNADTVYATTLKYDTGGVLMYQKHWLEGNQGTAIGLFNNAVYTCGKNFMLNKYSRNGGNLLWTFNGLMNGNITDIDFDIFKNIYITGYADTVVNGILSSQGLFFKLDSLGNKVWKITMPATSDTTSVNPGRYISCEIVPGQGVYFLGKKYSKSQGHGYCIKTQKFVEEITISGPKLENDYPVQNWSILENPASGIIEINSKLTFDLLMTDVAGRVTKLIKVSEGINRYDASDLKAGIYFLKPLKPEIKGTQKLIKL